MKCLSIGLLVLCWVSGGGCARTDVPKRLFARFQHEDPAVRNLAIRTAARTRDDRALPYLVNCLTDTQRDVRLFAARALRIITGEDLGYRHYAPAARRAEAAEKWRRWLRARAASQPATDRTDHD